MSQDTADNPLPQEDLNLEGCSKEELCSYVRQLRAHVKQLRNIIAKSNSTAQDSGHKHQQAFDFKKYKRRHVALKFLYLGWDYQGFTVQEDTANTIEAEMFKALRRTCLLESRETSNYHRCGRTDTGVSAFSQVISLDLRTNQLEGKGVVTPADYCPNQKSGVPGSEEIPYLTILNKVLPPEIRVIGWAPVEPGFSARFDCTRRTYKYFFPKGNLNITSMREAAQYLLGDHDFRNLCKMDVGNGVTEYTRRIFRVDIQPLGQSHAQSNSMWELTVEGKAFLWHQIRCIVAILMLVGQGREPPQIVAELLDIEKFPRKPQYSMAAELPLVLYDCHYEGVEWQIDQEALQAVISHLQKLWAENAIKSAMIHSMLDSLQPDCQAKVEDEALLIQKGIRPRVYKRLRDVPVCDSLQEKIVHYQKRLKIPKKGKKQS
ncbi:PUS3 [Cordylochernes scorpioides]|uniref:PUS3 n=1 Tax=Cordylochernes scorpioides TaxID=51811 RepID=A0ABY6KEK8_9ARAC|nr:PUS3 [Cordylochernes scorpioides]